MLMLIKGLIQMLMLIDCLAAHLGSSQNVNSQNVNF